jgi:hypothetical protein
MNRPMNRRLLVAVAVGVLLFEALTGYVLDQYGGEQYWPGLATGFGASLAAFVLALEWERFRDKAAVERDAEEANAARQTEARKRLLALEKELRRNRVSIELLKKRLPAGRRAITVTDFLHPELLDAAWGSSGERLGDLLAEYDLVADLAAFYGRLEELGGESGIGRIRHRTASRSSYIDTMAQALAEMLDEVDGLIDRVQTQAANPEVRTLGVQHVKSLGVCCRNGRARNRGSPRQRELVQALVGIAVGGAARWARPPLERGGREAHEERPIRARGRTLFAEACDVEL